MNDFILLHTEDTDERILIRVNNIKIVTEDSDYSEIETNDGDSYYVKESIIEIIKMIKE